MLLFPFMFALSECHDTRDNVCWDMPQTLLRFGIVHKLPAQLRFDQNPWLVAWKHMFRMWSVGRIAPITRSIVISPVGIAMLSTSRLVQTLMRLGSWRVCALSLEWRIHRKPETVEGSRF
jgi:hypothetical protein